MRTLLPFALLAVGAACNSISATQACADLTSATCAKLEQCAPSLVTGAWGDTTTCQARSTVTCESALALKNTVDTPSLADQCSKAIAAQSCSDYFTNNPPKDCIPTSKGKVADGSACGTAGQCASNTCQIDPTTGCGTCIEPVVSGQPCKAATDCQAGLVCALSTTAGAAVCIAPVASGATCSDVAPIIPCQTGLVCDSGSKTCKAPLAAGSACDPTVLPTLCDSANGYWCTPLGTRCQLVLFAGNGQPCGYNAKTGDLTLCSGSGFCAATGDAGSATCQAPAADNNACDTSKGPLCQPPAFCKMPAGADGGTAGTCTVVDPAMCQ